MAADRQHRVSLPWFPLCHGDVPAQRVEQPTEQQVAGEPLSRVVGREEVATLIGLGMGATDPGDDPAVPPIHGPPERGYPALAAPLHAGDDVGERVRAIGQDGLAPARTHRGAVQDAAGVGTVAKVVEIAVDHQFQFALQRTGDLEVQAASSFRPARVMGP